MRELLVEYWKSGLDSVPSATSVWVCEVVDGWVEASLVEAREPVALEAGIFEEARELAGVAAAEEACELTREDAREVSFVCEVKVLEEARVALFAAAVAGGFLLLTFNGLTGEVIDGLDFALDARVVGLRCGISDCQKAATMEVQLCFLYANTRI